MSTRTLARFTQPEFVDTKPVDTDRRLWSVTTLIGVLDKRAITYWACKQTALAAINQQGAWRGILDSAGPDEAVKWLCNAQWRKPQGQRSASELGTAVHAACEHLIVTGARPEILDDEVRPYVEQFERWCNNFQPEFIAAEVTVYSERYGYAGTCDGYLVIDGTRFIFDLKSSRESFTAKGDVRGVYPEIALQLAAYRWAEFIAVWRPRRYEAFRRRYYLLSPEERALAIKHGDDDYPDVDTGLGIHLTPEHCDAYPVRCDERVFRSYLHIVEAARWQFELADEVIAPPLQPPAREGAAS